MKADETRQNAEQVQSLRPIGIDPRQPRPFEGQVQAAFAAGTLHRLPPELGEEQQDADDAGALFFMLGQSALGGPDKLK